LRRKWSLIYSGNDASWMAWASWIVSRHERPDYENQIAHSPPPGIFELFHAVREPADFRLASQRSSLTGAKNFAHRMKRKFDELWNEFEILKDSVSHFESGLKDMKHFVETSLETYKEMERVNNIAENQVSLELYQLVGNQEDVDHTL
jgi:hypothetical protein